MCLGQFLVELLRLLALPVEHDLLLPGDHEAATEEAGPGALLAAHDPPAAQAVGHEAVLHRLALALVPARQPHHVRLLALL